jgi:DNA-directed RNA polymerase subunit RPC12/RpoP
MSKQCLKCNTEIASPWSFCPKCGVAVPLDPAPQSTPVEIEPAPAFGAFSGLYLGIIAVPLLIVTGGLLCLTGLGAFLGVPMIVLGVLAPLLGPMIGLGALKGKCPWCGTFVNSIADGKDFECIECSRRIAVQHHKFVKTA